MRQNRRNRDLSTTPAGRWPIITTLMACLAAISGAGCDGNLSKTEPAASKRLIPGHVRLVGDGVSSCSHQPLQSGGSGATADRWCAFTVDEVEGMPAVLWVLNVTQARTTDVLCDGSSPHCLRLTSALWTGQPVFVPAHPYVHGFYGDTLFFYTSETVSDEAFSGTIQAWRPGMTAGRALTGPNGIFCFAQELITAAVCLSNQTTPAKIEDIEFDLQGGQVTGAALGPLPVIDRIRPYEPDRTLVWSAQFSPTGSHFAYATKVPDGPGGPVPGARPVLRLRTVPTPQLGQIPAVEVLRDLQEWRFAPDGTRLLFLRDVIANGNGAESGTLTVADFPSGNNPTALAAGVGRYQVYGTSGGPLLGVGVFQSTPDSFSTFRIMNDLNKPTALVTVADRVENALVSPDLRYSFLQDASGDDDARSFIARNDGSGRLCPLTKNKGQISFSVRFLPTQRRVMFSEDATLTTDSIETPIEGWIADPDDCGRAQRYSQKLASTQPTADGLLYGETESGGITMAMRYVPFAPTGTLALDQTTSIARNVAFTTALLDQRLFVYTVEPGPTVLEPGLFVHGPLQ